MGSFGISPGYGNNVGGAAPQPAAFPATDNNQQTGASRQIGEFGGYPVGQVDVRTELMKQLEAAAAPLLMGLLGNPGGMSQQLGQMGGQVPRAAQGGLSQMLFGGTGRQPMQAPGGQGGQLPPWQAPPSTGGGNGSTGGGTNNGNVGPGSGTGGPTAGAGDVPTMSTGNPFENPLQGDPGGQNPLQPAPPSAPGPVQRDPTALLASFGLAPNAVGTTGILPGSNNFNLGSLNELLNPQGYLAGAQNPSAANGNLNGMMQLFGPGGMNKPIAGRGDVAVSELQRLLTQLGVNFAANGGLLDPNKFTIVGERGPEVIPPWGGSGGQARVIPGGQIMPGFGDIIESINGVAQQPMAPPQMSMGGTPGFNEAMQPQQMQVPQIGQPMQPMQTNTTNSAQASGAGMLGNALQNNPEQDVFNQIRQMLTGSGGMLSGGNAGQGVVNAMQPVFQQNLKFGLNELTNRVPSVRNSGAAIEGTDLTSRALNDFNLQAAQALQGGQQNTLQGMGMLGGLAGQAGNGQFNRALGAGQLATQQDLGYGQLDLQAQQQQWNQTVGPTLQLLMAALGMATPTAYQTIVPGKK